MRWSRRFTSIASNQSLIETDSQKQEGQQAVSASETTATREMAGRTCTYCRFPLDVPPAPAAPRRAGQGPQPAAPPVAARPRSYTGLLIVALVILVLGGGGAAAVVLTHRSSSATSPSAASTPASSTQQSQPSSH